MTLHRDREEDFIPAKIAAEFAYCPRAGYLEFVEADFVDNAYTLDAYRIHRRVDRPTHEPMAASGSSTPLDSEGAVKSLRGLLLASESLGIMGRLDLVEVVGEKATPVEYRRHFHPDPDGLPPVQDRIHVGIECMLLEEAGYTVQEGILFYADTKKRISVPFEEDLRRFVTDHLEKVHAWTRLPSPPEPLVDSPKCNGCSLVGLCLPDEVNLLTGRQDQIQRDLVPRLDEAQPLFVTTPGAKLRVSGDVLRVTEPDGTVALETGVGTVSQVTLFGNVQVTTQALRRLASRGITVAYLTRGGWLYGLFVSQVHPNVSLRIQQFRAADHAAAALQLGRSFVVAKILNCRTLLMRNAKPRPEDAIASLKKWADRAEGAQTEEELLGIEGNAAKTYFQAFHLMLRPPKEQGHEGHPPENHEGAPSVATFQFEARNRRPPRDPVNALLSFAYTLLLREVLAKVVAAGLDPLRGFYHKPRYKRPSLALDLMEEFRPIVADSTVITAINNGEIGPNDFVRIGGACSLRDAARRRFIATFLRRMDQEIVHPLFGYRINYRRVLEVQVRLLARFLMGDIDEYVGFRTR